MKFKELADQSEWFQFPERDCNK